MSEPKKKSSVTKKIVKAAVCLFVGFLLAVGIPKFMHARQASIRLACMNQLGQIDAAKNQWGLEHKKTGADIPAWQDLKPYIYGNAELKCPGGGTYTIEKVGEYPACSIASHSLQ